MSAPDLASQLASEIRAAVAAAAPPATGSTEFAPNADEEDIRLPLRRALAHSTPVVPDAVRFTRSKSMVLRLFRFLWRDQASFNALVLEAFNGVLAALARTREADGRREGALAGFRDELRRMKAEVDRSDAEQDARLAHLETRGTPAPAARLSAPAPAELPESVYAAFEERFRGDASEVSRKQRVYLPYLRGLPGPLFDAGCGRGEFLALLREEGVPAHGVESSSHAAAACRAAGLDVAHGDAVEALASTTPESLGAVTAFQVVEHWPAAQTFRFLAAARRALKPGGRLIVETVNTDSLAAMNAFYLDPTHVRPVPPAALEFLCEAAGFRDPVVEYLSPVPDAERLEVRSGNDARLNALLFAPRDYAVIARVPEDASPGATA